jgi:CheY-like chemotaxis protein
VLARIRPDLIVTDMQMPRMSGMELISALKSKPETANIPIIVVAARASGLAQSEKRANFAIYKDIDIEEQLSKALRAVFSKENTQAAGK